METKAYHVPPTFRIAFYCYSETLEVFAVSDKRGEFATLTSIAYNTCRLPTKENAEFIVRMIFGDNILDDSNFDVPRNYQEYNDAPISEVIHLAGVSINVLYSEPAIVPNYVACARRHNIFNFIKQAQAQDIKTGLCLLDALISINDCPLSRLARAELREKAGDLTGAQIDARKVLHRRKTDE